MVVRATAGTYVRPAVTAVREPRDVAGLAEILVLGVDLPAGGEEVLAQRVGPAPVRQGLLGGSAAKLMTNRSVGGIRLPRLQRTAVDAVSCPQYAPRRVSTAGIVLSMIDRSRNTDQRSR